VRERGGRGGLGGEGINRTRAHTPSPPHTTHFRSPPPPYHLHPRRHVAGPTGEWTDPDFQGRVRAFLATLDPVRKELWGMYEALGLKEKLA
jgi:hypothetical protein